MEFEFVVYFEGALEQSFPVSVEDVENPEQYLVSDVQELINEAQEGRFLKIGHNWINLDRVLSIQIRKRSQENFTEINCS